MEDGAGTSGDLGEDGATPSDQRPQYSDNSKAMVKMFRALFDTMHATLEKAKIKLASYQVRKRFAFVNMVAPPKACGGVSSTSTQSSMFVRSWCMPLDRLRWRVPSSATTTAASPTLCAQGRSLRRLGQALCQSSTNTTSSSPMSIGPCCR